MVKLVSHFRQVIRNIVVGQHNELPATSVITSDLAKRKKKRYFFTAMDCSHLWSTKQNPKALWLGIASLNSLYLGFEIRYITRFTTNLLQIVRSFHELSRRVEGLTKSVRDTFGEASVGVFGIGIPVGKAER